MKQTLKRVIEIGNTVSDPKVKLEAKRIAMDCYRHVMDLCANAGIVSDALKFVNQSNEKIDSMRPTEGETTEAEATTTNGIY